MDKNNNLRIGVIGAGRIGKIHAESIATRTPGAELAGIADVKTNHARFSGSGEKSEGRVDDIPASVNVPKSHFKPMGRYGHRKGIAEFLSIGSRRLADFHALISASGEGD